MLKRLKDLSGLVSDYTLGTVIVMVHMARVGRVDLPQLPERT